ncbi:MAG: TolC family protein [Candidatus Hydrothermales bacterium]
MIKLFLIFAIHLSEDKAVELSLSNPIIKSKIEEIKALNYSRNQIIKSFLPEIKSNFTYSYSTFVDKITQYVLVGIDPITFEPIYKPVEVEFGKPERRILNISLEWLLFSGLHRFYLLKMINSLKDSKIKEKELKEKEIELLVRILYSQGLFLKSAIEKYKEIIGILNEHVKIARKRFESGFTVELDVLRSEVEKKNLESTLSDFEKNYIKVLSLIKTFCNINDKDEIILTDSLKVDTVLEEKIKKRIDLEIISKNVESLEYSKKSTYSNFLPKIFGSVNYVYGKPYGFFKDEWGSYFQFYLGLSLDLFDFGKKLDEIRKKDSEKKATEYVLEFLRKKGEEEIISARREFEAALRAYESAKITVELAEKSIRISRSQYEKGFISNSDFLDTLRKSLEAHILYIASLFKLKETKIKYESTLYGVTLTF